MSAGHSLITSQGALTDIITQARSLPRERILPLAVQRAIHSYFSPALRVRGPSPGRHTIPRGFCLASSTRARRSCTFLSGLGS